MIFEPLAASMALSWVRQEGQPLTTTSALVSRMLSA